MKIKFSNLFLAIIIALSFITFSCEDQGNEEPTLVELAGVTEHTAQELSGSLFIGSDVVTYSALIDENQTHQISVSIGGQLLQSQISFGVEALSLDGHGAQLSQQQKSLLLQSAQHLFNYVDGRNVEEEVSFLEYGLIRMLEYWSNAPEAYAYGEVLFTADLSGEIEAGARQGNEGITCIRRNTFVNAEYDDARGVHSDRVRVGSKARQGYDCMGRCGANCGRWWIPSAWTKDCMDHDQCSNVNNSSGGVADGNCGDEFTQAADDYVFGVIRGCRG